MVKQTVVISPGVLGSRALLLIGGWTRATVIYRIATHVAVRAGPVVLRGAHAALRAGIAQGGFEGVGVEEEGHRVIDFQTVFRSSQCSTPLLVSLP